MCAAAVTGYSDDNPPARTRCSAIDGMVPEVAAQEELPVGMPQPRHIRLYGFQHIDRRRSLGSGVQIGWKPRESSPR